MGGKEARGAGTMRQGGHHGQEPGALCGCTRDWEYASQTMTLTVLAGLQAQAEN